MAREMIYNCDNPDCGKKIKDEVINCDVCNKDFCDKCVVEIDEEDEIHRCITCANMVDRQFKSGKTTTITLHSREIYELESIVGQYGGSGDYKAEGLVQKIRKAIDELK